MKVKLSISVDEKTVNVIRQHVAEGRFRNVSHALEYAILSMQDEKKE